jgi:cell pole-organizing protein PopZ
VNAPNPSSSERDLELLRRAQRAHEPSMEEILASIRSIIADDREPPAINAPVPKPAASGGPQIVYSNDSIPLARPAAAAPVPPAPAPAIEAVVAPPPKIVWEQPAPEPEPPLPPEAELEHLDAAVVDLSPAPEPIEEEPFASPETDAAVAASLHALSTTIAMHSSEMIEGLMREMLRPMLKNWLDDNLPSLVERLVRAEIQRVARGGR